LSVPVDWSACLRFFPAFSLPRFFFPQVGIYVIVAFFSSSCFTLDKLPPGVPLRVLFKVFDGHSEKFFWHPLGRPLTSFAVPPSYLGSATSLLAFILDYNSPFGRPPSPPFFFFLLPVFFLPSLFAIFPLPPQMSLRD